MLEHLGFEKEGTLIERAVRQAIGENMTTPDLGGNLGTREVGEAVRKIIERETPSK